MLKKWSLLYINGQDESKMSKEIWEKFISKLVWRYLFNLLCDDLLDFLCVLFKQAT